MVWSDLKQCDTGGFVLNLELYQWNKMHLAIVFVSDKNFSFMFQLLAASDLSDNAPFTLMFAWSSTLLDPLSNWRNAQLCNEFKKQFKRCTYYGQNHWIPSHNSWQTLPTVTLLKQQENEIVNLWGALSSLFPGLNDSFTSWSTD